MELLVIFAFVAFVLAMNYIPVVTMVIAAVSAVACYFKMDKAKDSNGVGIWMLAMLVSIGLAFVSLIIWVI